MVDKVLEDWQKEMMLDCSQKFDSVYSEPNGDMKPRSIMSRSPLFRFNRDEITQRQRLKLRQLADSTMANGDEHNGFSELNTMNKTGTGYSSSVSIDTIMSSCHLSLDLNSKITMKFFLKLGDEEQHENIG